MQDDERHVLTFEKPSVIRKVMDELSAGVESDGGAPPETRGSLAAFSKQSIDRLILNLRVTKSPFGETSAAIKSLFVCLLGGVLVVSGQVTAPWVTQLSEHARRHICS